MLVKDIAFQKDTVEKIINTYAENPVSRTLMVSPTGTGKTIICRLLLENERLREVLLSNKDRTTLRIIYKCHIERLITQARRRFNDKVVAESSIENWKKQDAGDPSAIPSTMKVEICYQMYSEKIDDTTDIDLIIYDECQHEACNTIQEFLSTAGKFPSLGMTATPERPDNQMIKFDTVIETMSRHEAVLGGFICETDIVTIVDTSTVHKIPLLKDILTHFHAEMGQTMIFVRTKAEIKQSVDFINSFLPEQARGCQDDDDIDALLDSFGVLEFKFLVSCKKLGEGIDVPNVTDVILARNMGSVIELNQYIGRSARIDVPECRVWEFVNALSNSNLSAIDVIDHPKSHRIVNKVNGQLLVRNF